MDATIHDLGQLLLKAIPTIIFFLFLTAYLNRVFFKPMAHILEERRRATEGMRELSEKAFAAADEKASDYERALQAARAEISAENEKLRQQWIQEQAETVARARSDSEARLIAERNVVKEEVARAGQDVETQIQPLADRIISSLLRRRAA